MLSIYIHNTQCSAIGWTRAQFTMQYLVLSGLVFKCKCSYIATFPLMSAQPMAGRQDADMLITCQAANLINTSSRKGVNWFCLHPPSKTTVY